MMIADAVSNFERGLQERIRNPRQVWGLPTGIAALDLHTGGLHPGQLVVVGGRTSMGKSALVLHMIAAVCRKLVADGDDRLVLFFSAEMSSDQVIARWVSQSLRLRIRDLMYPVDLKADELQEIDRVAAEIRSWPLEIDDTVSPRLAHIRQRVRELAGGWTPNLGTPSPFALIVVDHIGKVIATDERNQVITHEYTAQTTVAEALFKLARYFQTPVLAVSQLNRSVEHRENKRPQLSDLRDSGRIEENADVVLLLYRPGYYEAMANGGMLGTGPLDIVVAKGRNVGIGTVTVQFEPHCTRIEDTAP